MHVESAQCIDLKKSYMLPRIATKVNFSGFDETEVNNIEVLMNRRIMNDNCSNRDTGWTV